MTSQRSYKGMSRSCWAGKLYRQALPGNETTSRKQPTLLARNYHRSGEIWLAQNFLIGNLKTGGMRNRVYNWAIDMSANIGQTPYLRGNFRRRVYDSFWCRTADRGHEKVRGKRKAFTHWDFWFTRWTQSLGDINAILRVYTAHCGAQKELWHAVCRCTLYKLTNSSLVKHLACFPLDKSLSVIGERICKKKRLQNDQSLDNLGYN